MAPPSARESRCARRRPAALSWVDYRDPAGRLVENELEEVLQGSATQLEYDARRAEVEARLMRAAAGELAPPGELYPIRTNPEVWEIRWGFDGQQLRLYFAEPVQYPLRLVGLHYHWKWVAGTYSEVMAAQDAEIDIALARYARWLSNPAGHS